MPTCVTSRSDGLRPADWLSVPPGGSGLRRLGLRKDVAALMQTAAEAGYDFVLLHGVIEVNGQQPSG